MAETILRIPGKLVADEYGTKLANVSDLDNDVYGPYASVTAAHTALSELGLNTVGTTVGISGSNNTVVEYWYQGGTTQANLVEKSSGGGGSEQIQSDWNQTDSTKKDFIKNKPNIPDTSDYYTKSQSDNKYQPKGNYQPAGNYATKTELNGKVDKVSGKGLSTNDYTNEDKAKVAAAITEHQDISGKVDKIAGKGLSTNDYTNAEKQKVGNALVPADIAGKANASDVYTKSETYTKTEVNGLVDTPHQEYVTVDAYSNLPETGSKDTIYRVSNYNGSTSQVDASVYSQYAWNGSQYILLCVKSQIGEVFDISVYNNNAKYADLAAALNGGANIPQSLQKGGMSVKFVQSSDNNYIQARLMAQNFTTDTTQWAITEEGVYVDNPEYVYVKTDAEDKILWAIRTDGSIYYGAGVPPQIIDYINEKIAELSPDEYEDIVAFLNGLEEGDKTLQTLLDEKVDKVENKSLIDSEYAASQSVVDDPEWLQVTTDSEEKILEGITAEGKKKVMVPIVLQNIELDSGDDPEYLQKVVDNEGKVIEGIRKCGKYFEYAKASNFEVTNHLNLSIDAAQKLQRENGLSVGNWKVPAYYTGYLKHKIRVVSNLIRDTIIDGDAFYFITDTHWEYNQQHSPAIIKQMNRLLNIPMLLHGGDIYHNGLSYDGYNIDCVNQFRSAMDNPNRVYFTDGNHEFIYQVGDYGDIFAESRIFLDNVVFGGENKNYYYFDNNVKKIRYINLYSFGKYVNGQITKGFLDNEQVSWFRDIALNVDSGWKIIIFSHYFADLSLPELQVTHIAGFENIADVINNYSGNGEILALINGHTHADFVDFSGCNSPIIVTTCDHNYNFRVGYGNPTQYYLDLSDLIEPRVGGTVNEQAFDIVVWDANNRVLQFVRIGSRAMNRSDTFNGDAQVDYRTIFIDGITVGATKTLRTLLTGNLTWRTADNYVASVTNGVITANAIGSTVITAESDNGEKQAYYIKIINL